MERERGGEREKEEGKREEEKKKRILEPGSHVTSGETRGPRDFGLAIAQDPSRLSDETTERNGVGIRHGERAAINLVSRFSSLRNNSRGKPDDVWTKMTETWRMIRRENRQTRGWEVARGRGRS